MILAHKTWPQVAEYLKKDSRLIIPIGSTEQHGPTGMLGIDYITAQKIAEELGKRENVLVAPPICYGMAYHHLAFPGSSALKPSTLVLVVSEIVQNFARHGFNKILLINGHGGNIAPITTAFCEIKTTENKLHLQLENWWKMPEVQEYEQKHFGDQNGFHATVGEVSATMFLEQEAYKNIPHQNFTIERPKHPWPMSPEHFREVFPDGRMESNPGLASVSHGEKIFEIAVKALCLKIRHI